MIHDLRRTMRVSETDSTAIPILHLPFNSKMYGYIGPWQIFSGMALMVGNGCFYIWTRVKAQTNCRQHEMDVNGRTGIILLLAVESITEVWNTASKQNWGEAWPDNLIKTSTSFPDEDPVQIGMINYAIQHICVCQCSATGAGRRWETLQAVPWWW